MITIGARIVDPSNIGSSFEHGSSLSNLTDEFLYTKTDVSFKNCYAFIDGTRSFGEEAIVVSR